jgi:hypothetical protein
MKSGKRPTEPTITPRVFKLVYYHKLYSSKVYGNDELWAYTEDDGKYFNIVHKVIGTENRVCASREELEQILKNEEVQGPVGEDK